MESQTKRVLGKYILTEVLGGTALATVFRAWDPEGGREVAAKVLRPYVSQEPDTLERFISRMREVQQLRHPNILPIYGVEREDDAVWIVEELVSGSSLREQLRVPIGPVKALAILRQVAEAIDFAHSKGVLHLNIKPGNVFVLGDGTAVLEGFGMVILAQGAHALVRTGLSTPLPTYTAPEQAQGVWRDHRSDIYSLGVLFYEMVTMAVPFHGLSAPAILAQQLRSYPPPPSSINRRLPEALDEVVLKALDRRPGERYSSAKEFVRALEPIIGVQLEVPSSPLQSVASPATPPESSQEKMVVCPHCGRANRPGTVHCNGCWGSLRGVGAVGRELERELTRKRRAAIRRNRLLRWSVILVVVLGLGSWMAYENIGAAQFKAPPVSAISSTSGPGEWAMFQRDPGHTGFVPDQGHMLRGEVKWRFQTGAPFLSSPAVVGNRIYLSTGDRRLVALEAETGAVVWEYPVTGPVDSSPAVAGEMLFVGLRDGRVLALDRERGELRWQFHTGNPVYSSPVVYEGVLYVGSGSGKLFALDAITGEQRWSYFTDDWIVTSPAVNDEVVTVVALDNNVHVVGTKTGKNRLLYSLGRQARGSPVLQGDRLYVTDDAGRLRAIDWGKKEFPVERFLQRIKTQFFIWGMLDKLPTSKGFVWVFKERGGRFFSTPAVAWNKVYVSSLSGRLYAVDQETGKEIWQFQAEAPMEASPSVVQKTVFVGDMGGTLYALNADTGEKQWEFKMGAGISSTPVVANGVLYLGAQDGVLYAIR